MVREKKHEQRAGSDLGVGEGVAAASVVDRGVDFCFYDKSPVCPVVEGFCIGFRGALATWRVPLKLGGKAIVLLSILANLVASYSTPLAGLIYSSHCRP